MIISLSFTLYLFLSLGFSLRSRQITNAVMFHDNLSNRFVSLNGILDWFTRLLTSLLLTLTLTKIDIFYWTNLGSFFAQVLILGLVCSSKAPKSFKLVPLGHVYMKFTNPFTHASSQNHFSLVFYRLSIQLVSGSCCCAHAIVAILRPLKPFSSVVIPICTFLPPCARFTSN